MCLKSKNIYHAIPRLISVGCALDLGSLMVARGTTATGKNEIFSLSFSTDCLTQVWRRRGEEQPWQPGSQQICPPEIPLLLQQARTESIFVLFWCVPISGTWTTCSRWSLSQSCTLWWRTRWRRCSSTTCHGSRSSSSRSPWTSSASAGERWCTPMSSPTILGRTTSLPSLKIIRRTWSLQQNSSQSKYCQYNVFPLWPNSSGIWSVTFLQKTWWTSSRKCRTSTGMHLLTS